MNAFEEDLKRFVGEGKEVVALSAGTAAVHLALLACGVDVYKRQDKERQAHYGNSPQHDPLHDDAGRCRGSGNLCV